MAAGPEQPVSGKQGSRARGCSGGSPKPKATKVAARAPASRTERAAERRAAIVDAAMEEFIARGFAATRLDDIAKRAGVAKGTIYLHFKDKESMFEELIRTAIVPFVGPDDRAAAGHRLGARCHRSAWRGSSSRRSRPRGAATSCA